MRRWSSLCILLLAAVAAPAAPELRGETSHPVTSPYAPGEPVTLTVTVSGLPATPVAVALATSGVADRQVGAEAARGGRARSPFAVPLYGSSTPTTRKSYVV